MPDKDIQDFDTIASADGADYALVIDASDPTDHPTGSLKRVLISGGGAAPTQVNTWVSFNGTGTPAIRDSLNVSSLDDDATGQIGVNFTTAYADTNYSVTVGGSVAGAGIPAHFVINEAAGGVDFYTYRIDAAGYADTTRGCLHIIGTLA